MNSSYTLYNPRSPQDYTLKYGASHNEQYTMNTVLQKQLNRYQEPNTYDRMTQNKEEELKLQNAVLKTIFTDKNSGQIPEAWGLITYMEANRPVREIYVTEKYYVIDNSEYIQDQFRIGLKSLHASQAEILSEGYLHIVLSKNETGSIYLTNNSNFPVFVKDYLEVEKPCFSQQVIEHQGIITSQEEQVEIFDIEEFRSEMALQIYHNQYNIEQLMLFCKTNILLAEAQYCTESSSWIMVTNLQALDLVSDSQEYSALEEKIANFVAADTLHKMRTIRKKTLKKTINTLPKEFETKRKTRMSLIMKGLKVKDFMKYSWEKENVVTTEDALNMKELGQFFEPEKDYMSKLESGNRKPNQNKLVGNKMWAKVKYILENMNNENI